MADNNEFYRLNLVLKMDDRLSSAMSKVDGKVAKFNSNLSKTQKTVDKLGGSHAEPKVTVDTSKAEAQLNKTNKLLEQIAKKIAKPRVEAEDKTAPKVTAIQSRLRRLTSRAWRVTVGIKDEVSGKLGSMRNALSSPMGMLGVGMATMGIGSLVADSANEAMNFSAEISNIKALTQLPQDQIDKIRAKAMQLGKDTQFSTLQAAQGMTELLKAGVGVEDVMGGASQAMLDLAAAGGLELPEAAEIMSTAMNAFHMRDAAHAADILAGAANASATDVHELRYALSMCSAVAAGVGMSFEDTNTALAVFAQNGLKGSDAGTSLKTMLSRLEPMTKTQYGAFEQLGLITENGTSAFYDQEGKLRSLAEIADLLKTKLGGLTNEEQQKLLYEMFGSDAIRGGMILMREGADGVKKMFENMTHYTASDVAIEKMNNAKGAVERMKGSFENFQIEALAPMEPVIAKIAESLDALFDNDADGASNRVKDFADNILYLMECLENNEEFQQMDWGDKIVYVLDRMMEAIDKWASGPGGEQFGKVMTKLAEIGMRAFLAALLGLMKGSLNALMHGNLAGAAGLAMGASFLGAGTVLKGGYSLAKGAGRLAAGTSMGQRVAGTYEAAKGLASEGGSGGLMSRIKGAGFTAEMFGSKALGGLATLAKSPIVKGIAKFAAPVGMAIDAYGVYNSDNKGAAIGGMAGRWGGMALGAKAGAAGGAAIGAGFAGVGAAPGAAIGGALGGLGGFFAGDKLGTMLGQAAAALDFGPIKEKIIAEKDEIAEAAGQWFDSLPEKLGYVVGYAVTTLAGLPGAAADYFSQLVTDAESYMSELPGRISAWWQQTEADAIAFASSIVTDVEQFFANLPSIAEQKWSELYNAVTNWCSNTIAGIRSWFSQIPGIISGYFDSAISSVRNKVSGLWGDFKIGFNAGSAAAQRGHAEGGIFNKEHIARFAEGGKAEAVVPLDASMRTQGLSIWQQAGQMLGINADLFANAGTGGAYQPAYAGAGGSGEGGGGSSNAFHFNGMRINIGGGRSQDEMAMDIGRRILSEITQSFENRE